MNNFVNINDFAGGEFTIGIGTYGNESFNDLITEYQEKCLIKTLGESLYNAFVTDTPDITPATQKWLDLLNGKTYTDTAGNTRNWKGLKYLLVPYIFYHWITTNDIKQVPSGTVKPKFENSDSVNEYNKKTTAYNAWNAFVNRHNECFNFLYVNETDYPDFDDYFQKQTYKFIVTKTSIG